MVYLDLNYYFINCFNCNVICSCDCYSIDNDVLCNCCVMKNGYCIVCLEKCNWKNYKNVNYEIVYKVRKVIRIY